MSLARSALTAGGRAALGSSAADTMAAGTHRRAPLCVINGRFYGQPVTGVQRYGREIVRALEPLLTGRGATALLALPRGTAPPPSGPAVAATGPSRVPGHVWEQSVLPLTGTAPLLNLCNTAPVARRRQVVCLHDANVLTQPGSYSRGFRLFYRTLHPLLARRAAVIATVSHASADDLARHLGLERSRIAVLPNGHEHALRWWVDDTVMTRVPARRPFVLLLGSRARHKNIGLMLRLAPALDDLGIDLVITGGSAAIFAAEEAPQPAMPNVHLLGKVSDGELAALLARALCLAFPSWTEGFGLPIVEAMARGCPVVASNRASMPEVCGNAALMAAPDDPQAWRDAVAALHGSPALRADLAGRGAEQARRFSWADSAAGYLDLLERLA